MSCGILVKLSGHVLQAFGGDKLSGDPISGVTVEFLAMGHVNQDFLFLGGCIGPGTNRGHDNEGKNCEWFHMQCFWLRLQGSGQKEDAPIRLASRGGAMHLFESGRISSVGGQR